MSLHNLIGPFDAASEDWASYVERLQHYFTAQGLESEEKRCATLLAACGPATYSRLRSLAAPRKLSEFNYIQLTELAATYFHPTQTVAIVRYKFNSRNRQPNESVADYVTELRRLAESCKYNDVLDEMLRDRLVCGINDQRIQRRLLAEGNLSFQKAFELAQAFEAAEQDVQKLHEGSQRQVHSVRPEQRRQDQYRKPRSSQPSSSVTQPSTPCPRCGGQHWSRLCRFQTAVCHSCGKRGHLRRVCRSQPTKPPRSPTGKQTRPLPPKPLRAYSNRSSPSDTHHFATQLPDDSYSIFQLTESTTEPLRVSVTVHGVDLLMEIDTGAAVSLISRRTYRTVWPAGNRPELQPSSIRLRTYSGQIIQVLGEISVVATYQNQSKRLPLLVVPTDGPSLFGRDWLKELQLDWKQLHHVQLQRCQALQNVLDRHAPLFNDELGTLRDTKVTIHVQPDAHPRFFRPRPVPYALRGKVETELQRLQDTGVITPVKFSEWAAPIVPVLKHDGSMRICGDFKVTVNRSATPDTYPLPKVTDIFASLAGGDTFTKLDLAHAYQQLVLDEPSSNLVTINTSKGLYRYNRLPFGISAAPSIFQRTMENLLQGIPQVSVYIDDVLVTGRTDAEHLHNLSEVLRRMAEAGMRLKRDKCYFMLPQVQYLGHIISRRGIQPTEEKVEAIRNAPTPTDVQQLKSFLGLLNFYSKFLPRAATRLAPLYLLLQKRQPWTWGLPQRQAFQAAKHLLTSSALLAHYSDQKELIVACDASSYGVGAVLSHREPDGTEKPIAYASRALAPAERRYSQLDKEALAIVFGVRKFHQYIYGRHFSILSDHKPLQHLFGEHRAIPPMASSRLQRWAITLSAYDYSILYRSGKHHANADLFSRLPLPVAKANIPQPGDCVLLFECLQVDPLSAADIKKWTDRDPILSKVRSFLLQGWPTHLEGEEGLQPYLRRQEELSTENGCVMWGSRVVVPPPARNKVIEVLHDTHPGITRMKGLARSYVWWPGMDTAIEDQVKGCHLCQQSQKSPSRAPLHPWEWPERAWARVHIDYAGPFEGHMFLLLVDAHSKWIEVHPVKQANSITTIQKLRAVFATHGLPELIVSDNGSVFTSSEFKEFTSRNAIRHVTTAPYHPSSNGLAERAVQTFKAAMKKITAGSVETRVARFLFQYRLTPHASTGRPPAELLLGRRPRSLLDNLKPDISAHVRRQQERQKLNHDTHVSDRQFNVSDQVFVRQFSQGNSPVTWIPGTVEAVRGPLSYLVRLLDGRLIRRHVDHVRRRLSELPTTSTSSDDDISFDISCTSSPSTWPTVGAPSPPRPPVPLPRRSSRIRRPPERWCPPLGGRKM